jgi:hypothetical protein
VLPDVFRFDRVCPRNTCPKVLAKTLHRSCPLFSLFFRSDVEGLKLYSSLLDPRSNSVNATPCPHSGEVANASSQPLVSTRCMRIVARDAMRRRITGPLSGCRSARRRTLSFAWSRKAFGLAKEMNNASFQEMLLAVLSDGLSRYCQRHSVRSRLRAVLPLGRTGPNGSGDSSNQHDIGFIDLPSGAINWTDRIKKIRGGLYSLRCQQRERVFPTILGFLTRLPSVVRTFVANRWSAQSNLLISVIPGGITRQKIGRAEVESLFAQPALPPNHAVVIGAMITRRSVYLSIQIDPEVICDPLALKTDLARAYASIQFPANSSSATASG